MDSLISTPSLEHFRLIKYLLFTVIFLHVIYIGSVLTTALIQIFTGSKHTRLKEELSKMPVSDAGSWLVFGILSLLTSLFLLSQYTFASDFPVESYFTRSTLIVFAGLLLIFLYQRIQSRLIGIPGLIISLTGYFFLISSGSLLIYPEHWGLIPTPLPHFFSVTPLIHFLIFGALSLLSAGTIILFFKCRWRETALDENSEYYCVVKNLGSGLILTGCISLPPLVIWDLLTLPDPALSSEVFYLSGTLFVFLIVPAGLSAGNLLNSETRGIITSGILIVLSVAVLLISNFTLQANANREFLITVRSKLKAKREDFKGRQKKRYKKTEPVSEERGKKVFNRKCTSCHGWDEKIVGPPLKEVLPKYKNKHEQLKEFINNPVKKNPDYPSMPPQNLNPNDLDSVVEFLLNHEKLRETGK